jgi:hypothetical protein
VLSSGGWLREVYPGVSEEDAQRRFNQADQIMGISWWQMNCHQTMDFIVLDT